MTTATGMVTASKGFDNITYTVYPCEGEAEVLTASPLSFLSRHI